jgi:hypothetical protein
LFADNRIIACGCEKNEESFVVGEKCLQAHEKYLRENREELKGPFLREKFLTGTRRVCCDRGMQNGKALLRETGYWQVIE